MASGRSTPSCGWSGRSSRRPRCTFGTKWVRVNPPIRLYMSMSLDGFITGPDDRAGQELGHDSGRLFNWIRDARTEA